MITRHGGKVSFLIGCWAVITLANIVLLPARYGVHASVETVKSAPMQLVVRAPGNLEAKASVTIKAQFDGAVDSKQFREGQKVKAGDLLAVLNRDKIRLAYQEKQDALTNAKGDLLQARKEVRLQKTLYSKQAVALSAVEEAKRNLIKATQALRSAEEGWKQEVERWNSAQVISPIAGTVIKDGIGDEKQITSGKEIVSIADVSEFTVKAKVDELDIKRVTENLPADIHVQIYPQTIFKAHVHEIDSQPESQESSAIPVILVIDDTQNILLRPKLTADVWIITGQTASILSVPLAAINNADGSTRVWVLDAWNRLRTRAVTLGQANPDRVEVKEGLRAGDRVCAVTEPSLAEGMHVVLGSPKEKR